MNITFKIIYVKLFLLTISYVSYSQQIIDLEGAIQIASQNSPNIQQSRLSLQYSQQKLIAQRARLKSQFSLTLKPFEYEKTNRFDQRTSEWFLNESASSSGTVAINQRILPTDGVISLRNTFSYDYNYTESRGALDPVSETYNNSLRVALTQPIFTYNRTKMELERLELNYETSLLRYHIQRLNLERTVAQEFYAVYSQQMTLNITHDKLKNSSDDYIITKNKVEGGLLAREELYQSEVNLAKSRSSAFNANISMQNTLDKFKVLIGLPMQDSIVIIAEIETNPVVINEEDAITRALNNRMELRNREIDIENSMFSLIQARSTNEFSGSISASFGLQANNEDFGLLFDKSAKTPAVGITLAIPLFDWGERKAEIKAAELNLRSSEIDLEKEKIDIELNLRAILRNMDNLKQQIDIQKKTVENAELTYEINRERYLNGDLTSLNLGIYQNQLSDSKIALTNAIINYKLELLNLKIQTLYDFENQASVVPLEIIDNEKQ